MAVRRHAEMVAVNTSGGGSNYIHAAMGIEPPAWTEDAVCAQTDPDAFFPEKGGSTREAKAICHGCPVQVECLDFALTNEERFGIWGGVSERDRRRLTRGTKPKRDRDIPCGHPGCPELFNHPGHAGRHRRGCAFRPTSLDQQEPA